MIATNFKLRPYLERIGFTGVANADATTVAKLMRHQLFTVPFENLDVLNGKGISLVPEDIVDKIVERRRGGYCYEVNGLFAMALTALGVPYQFVACRPMVYPALRPRTHMALVVTFDSGRWLYDLGFGSYGIRAPMRLDEVGEVRQDYDTYQLCRPNQHEYLLRAHVDGEWASQYAFDLWPQQWIDFMPANYLNSTHPESLFVQKRVVALHTSEGRAILLGNRLKTVARGVTETREITPHDSAVVLRELFGLETDSP